MNEAEYLQSRIKYLERIIINPDTPQKIRINQLNALKSYKTELNNLNRKSF